MKWKIWLDDIRESPQDYVWCRSVNECKNKLNCVKPWRVSSCSISTTISANIPWTAVTESHSLIGLQREILCIPLLCTRKTLLAGTICSAQSSHIIGIRINERNRRCHSIVLMKIQNMRVLQGHLLDCG